MAWNEEELVRLKTLLEQEDDGQRDYIEPERRANGAMEIDSILLSSLLEEVLRGREAQREARLIAESIGGALVAFDASPSLEAASRLKEAMTTEHRFVRKIADGTTSLCIRGQVSNFHYACDQEVRLKPSIPAEKIVRLRGKLVVEETLELVHALFGSSSLLDEAKAILGEITSAWTLRVDLPALADACGDIDFVVEGTRLAFGIDGRPIADAIYESNMAKKKGPRDSNGKQLKPEGWKPPDFARLLRDQGWNDQTWSEVT